MTAEVLGTVALIYTFAMIWLMAGTRGMAIAGLVFIAMIGWLVIA